MALAIDASSPAVVTVTSGTTATTASFTPPSGSLLVVAFAGNTNGSANPAAPTITDNLGSPLTYTRQVWRSHADGSPAVAGHCAIWTAPVPSSAAMTVTVTTSGTGTQPKAIRVWVITGQDTSDPIGVVGGAGSASASSIAQNYTAQSTGGQGFMSVCDWDLTGTPTAGTDCTVNGAGSVGSDISYAFARRTAADDSNGVTNTLRVTLGGTSTNVQWCWVEINPAAGGGTEHTVTPTDSAGLTDTAVLARSLVLTDSAGLTDTAALARSTVVTDSAGLTDTAALTRSLVFTDSAGLTDASVIQLAKLVEATDSAGLTDTAALARSAVHTDSAGLTDTAALDRAMAHTDSAGLTDSATSGTVTPVTVTDSAGLTDASVIQLAKVVEATDSAGLTDTAVLARSLAHTDSAGLTDTATMARSVVFTDSAGLTDSAALARAAVHTDSAGLTDSAIVLPVKLVEATDSAGLTDGVITQTGTATIFLPAGLVPVKALSAAEILTGNRTTRLRYDLYTRTEAALGNLTGVKKGSIDFTASASVKSGGALDIVDIGQSVDWLNDRVRPVVIIDGLPEIPLGMFLFSEAPEQWGGTGRTWSVKLLDKTTILDQDAVDGTYSLDVATVITDAVVDLIESTGETNIAITPSASTLAAPLAWQAGTTKLRIVNDLLAVAGYFSLWCDGNGQYRGEPYVRPANRPIRYEFLDGSQSIYSPDFVRDVDLHSIPNKFVAVGQGAGAVEALTSVATNTDPDSPYSFAARGRWIVKTATGVEAASQTVLDDYARRRLIELTSPTSSIEIAHALVPDLTFNNAVRLRRVPAGVDARHVVTKMVITLDPTALVKSTLLEVVDL